MKDKRGLVKFVVNLIIGLICFVILFYLFAALLSVVFPFYTEQKLQAKGMIESIYEGVNALPVDGSKDILVYAPQGWHLMGFDKSKKDYNIKLPPACNNRNCLCICQWGVTTRDCLKNAFCKDFEKPFFWEGKDLDIRIVKTNLKFTNKELFFDVREIKQ